MRSTPGLCIGEHRLFDMTASCAVRVEAASWEAEEIGSPHLDYFRSQPELGEGGLDNQPSRYSKAGGRQMYADSRIDLIVEPSSSVSRNPWATGPLLRGTGLQVDHVLVFVHGAASRLLPIRWGQHDRREAHHVTLARRGRCALKSQPMFRIACWSAGGQVVHDAPCQRKIRRVRRQRR